MAKENAELLNARKLRRKDRAAIARLRKDIHILKERLELQTLKSTHPLLPSPGQPVRGDRPVRSS